MIADLYQEHGIGHIADDRHCIVEWQRSIKEYHRYELLLETQIGRFVAVQIISIE